MKNLLGLVLLLASTLVMAEEKVPDYFETMYDQDVRLVLSPDQCVKSDVTMGWIVQAEQLSTGEKAQGCWRDLNNGQVQLYLVVGEKVYVEYVLNWADFKPVFEDK